MNVPLNMFSMISTAHASFRVSDLFLSELIKSTMVEARGEAK